MAASMSPSIGIEILDSIAGHAIRHILWSSLEKYSIYSVRPWCDMVVWHRPPAPGACRAIGWYALQASFAIIPALRWLCAGASQPQSAVSRQSCVCGWSQRRPQPVTTVSRCRRGSAASQRRRALVERSACGHGAAIVSYLACKLGQVPGENAGVGVIRWLFLLKACQ